MEVPVISLEASNPAHCCPQQEKISPLNALSALLESRVPGSGQQENWKGSMVLEPSVVLKRRVTSFGFESGKSY